MITNRLTPYEIVNKIIGNTSPVGETNEDNIRLENLRQLCGLVEKLINDIEYVKRFKDSQEYSVKIAGEYAEDFLESIRL